MLVPKTRVYISYDRVDKVQSVLLKAEPVPGCIAAQQQTKLLSLCSNRSCVPALYNTCKMFREMFECLNVISRGATQRPSEPLV